MSIIRQYKVLEGPHVAYVTTFDYAEETTPQDKKKRITGP